MRATLKDYFAIRSYWKEFEIWLIRGLEASQKLGDQSREAQMEHELGRVYANQGNYALAREHYQKALGLAEALQDHPKLASILHQLGVIEMYQANYNNAWSLFNQVLICLKTRMIKMAEVLRCIA